MLRKSYICRVVFYFVSSFSGFGAGEGVDGDWDCSSFSGLGVMDGCVVCWDSGLGWEDWAFHV